MNTQNAGNSLSETFCFHCLESYSIDKLQSANPCKFIYKLIILEVLPLICDLIESIECNIGVVLLKCFMEFLSIRHWLYNKQTLLFIANLFGSQKRSIISAHMLIIEASKIDTCVKGHKWIDTIKYFQ